ncbi:hypothetical protein EIP91_002295 [Steccherinum ochraceum]|uniref:Protein kinase domain-containing protein n=1 Tax=Steccherinum ochraceum TaxID=92696 RepID=A0A4R0RKW4_9APHY|nr:hypothetical protein EIP91_002295 [Steccherinum ochraceum]
MNLPPTNSKEFISSPRKPDALQSMPTQHFTDQRKEIMKTLPTKIPEVTPEWFFTHAVPELDSALVDRTITTLKENGTIHGGRWKGFKQNPSTRKELEDVVFAPIQAISDAVLDAAQAILRRPVTARTVCEPRRVLKSDSINGGYKSDAIQMLKKTTAPPDLPTDELYGPDCVTSYEFKNEDTAAKVNQNREQLLSNASNMFFADPARRFRFAVTIENTRMRLWLLSRTITLATSAFNFITEQKHFVQFLMATSFATRQELGYDPTVTRVHIKGPYKIAYEYSLQAADGERKIYRTCGPALFSHQAHRILGRATRIWPVQEVNEKGDVIDNDAVHVLKDYWLGEDSPTESQIQQGILEAAAKAQEKRAAEEASSGSSGNEENVNEDPKQYFMNILHDTVVELAPGKPDNTRSYLSALPPSNCPALDLFYDITRPASSAHHSTHNAAISSPQFTMTPPSGLSDYPKLAGHIYESRKHCRLVFDELGTPLHEISDHSTIFNALSQAVRGLQVFHDAGYVHRDISTGNLLVYTYKNGTTMCKISDLEYARLVFKDRNGDDNTSPKTGTPAYMAVEVLEEKYKFRRERNTRPLPGNGTSNFADRRPKANFLHNYLHDLEGLWWIAMWLLFHTLPHSLSEKITGSDQEKSQAEVAADVLFNIGISGSTARASLFIDEWDVHTTTDYLPSEYEGALAYLDNIRVALADAYTALENPLAELEVRLREQAITRPVYGTLIRLFEGMRGSAVQNTVYVEQRRRELRQKEAKEKKPKGKSTASNRPTSTKRKAKGKAHPDLDADEDEVGPDNDVGHQPAKRSKTSKPVNAEAGPSTRARTSATRKAPAAKVPPRRASGPKASSSNPTPPSPPRTKRVTRASSLLTKKKQ